MSVHCPPFSSADKHSKVDCLVDQDQRHILFGELVEVSADNNERNSQLGCPVESIYVNPEPCVGAESGEDLQGIFYLRFFQL